MIKASDYNISKEVLKKVNWVINEIVCFFKDLRKEDDKDNIEDDNEYLMNIFPRSLVREDKEKCEKILSVFQDYLLDDYYHSLSAVQERLLYYLLRWYQSVTDEFDKGFNVKIEEQYIETEDDKWIASNINDLDCYLEFMFYDWDFDDIPELLELHKIEPKLVSEVMHVDIDEYLDLMPKDIREEYLKTKNNKIILSNDLEGEIIKEISSAIEAKQADPRRLSKLSENQLSDDIADIMNAALRRYNIIVQREKRAGFSAKNVGEVDFYIYSNKDNIYKLISVGENKEWGKYKKQINQLIGYINQDVSFAFTIIFNKSVQFKNIIKKRKEIIADFKIGNEDKFKIVEEVQEIEGLHNVLLSKHINTETDKEIRIYHFIINSYMPDIELASKEARK